jgi:cyclophilin family peptidyl-prolyl cis-trans isomerase
MDEPAAGEVGQAELYAFLDVDVAGARASQHRLAQFVRACDLRYGLSSNDLRALGGAELPRAAEFYSIDHEWCTRGPVVLRREQSRLLLRLFPRAAPLACENFLRLCRGKEKEAHLSYLGSVFHRVVPGFVAQGGDFLFGNGSGGESVFTGRKFKDEKGGLALKHARRGILSMGNSGKNSNTSQFFLTLDSAPACDGKHVVFGELLSGFDALAEIERCGTPEGKPSAPITVTACGEWLPGEGPAAGYWYDVPDPESFAGFTATFMAAVRCALVVPSDAAHTRFAEALANCSGVHLLADDAPGAAALAKAAGGVGAVAAAAALLDAYVVDLVLVAPACAELPGRTPADQAARVRPAVLVVKPSDAPAAIRAWVQQRSGWSGCCLDDLLSARAS